MKRGLWVLLVASLALNVGFLSASIVHFWDVHHAPPPGPPGLAPHPPDAGPGPMGPGAGKMFGRGRGRGPWFGSRPADLRHQWPEHRVKILSEALDLTPDQQARLGAVLDATRGAIRERAEALGRERMIMRRALLDEDREMVRRQARKVNVLQAELDSLVAEAMLSEGEIFTPEQRAKLHDLELEPDDQGKGRMLERSERP